MSKQVTAGALLTALTTQLLSWNDDLSRGNVLRVRERMVQEANGSDRLASWLQHRLWGVARVTNDKRSLGRLRSAPDSHGLAAFHEDLVDVGVEHVGASVDSTKSAESLRKSANTVNRIEERRVAISSLRVDVELHLHDGVNSGLKHEGIVVVEGDGVAKEVNGTVLNAEVVEHLFHGLLFDVQLAPSLWVVWIDASDVLVEVGDTPLLKQTHETGLDGLRVIGRHLFDCHLL